jgi:hypothetical protein
VKGTTSLRLRLFRRLLLFLSFILIVIDRKSHSSLIQFAGLHTDKTKIVHLRKNKDNLLGISTTVRAYRDSFDAWMCHYDRARYVNSNVAKILEGY